MLDVMSSWVIASLVSDFVSFRCRKFTERKKRATGIEKRESSPKSN